MFERRKDSTGEGASGSGRAAPPQGRSDMPPTPAAAPRGGISGPKAAVGPTIFVKGQLAGDEDVLIAGQFEGTVDLPNHSLTVVESGQVRADVRAHAVVVQGELTGDVVGLESVMVVRAGQMKGNIKSPRVILEDGAEFNGSIDMAVPEAEAAPARAARPAAEGAAKPKVPAQGAGGETRQPKQPDAAS